MTPVILWNEESRYHGIVVGWCGTNPRDIAPGTQITVRRPTRQAQGADRWERLNSASQSADIMKLDVGAGPSIRIKELAQTAFIFSFEINPALLETLTERDRSALATRDATLLREKNNEVDEMRERIKRLTASLDRVTKQVDKYHDENLELRKQIAALRDPLTALKKVETGVSRRVKI